MKIFKLIIPLFLICCNSPSNEDSQPQQAKEIKYSVDLNIIEDFFLKIFGKTRQIRVRRGLTCVTNRM